jgi:nucleoside-diphosphate-sugar epimerase
MSYDLYSKRNRLVLEGTVVGASFCLAYLVAYAGNVPATAVRQMWLLVLPIVVCRLLTSFLFGLQRVQWRYIGVKDAVRLILAYGALSCVLLLFKWGSPEQWALLRIPGGVITIEFLLSTQGALAVRLVRRYIYELQSHAHDAPSLHSKEPKHLLLIGAGTLGSTVAKEMSSRPGIEIVGFLDDDRRKIGSMIAGIPVLGPTTLMTKLVQERKIDNVLVCIAPSSRHQFTRLWMLLERLPVRTRFVPTIDEILAAEDEIRVDGNNNRREKNGPHLRIVSKPQTSQEPRSVVRNKNILITGGAGFIGSSLAERLVTHNQVTLFDRFFQEQPVSFTGLAKHHNVRMVEGDIMNGSSLAEIARDADIVVHAAAIVGVGRVCSNSRATLETNFVGTSRLLQTLETNSHLDRLIYFSTSEVFGVNSFRVNESTPANVGPSAEARWSYAIAKLAGEHLMKSYHRETGMPMVTVRPFNIFGPRRLGAHAIRQFVLNALTGTPIEVHGDGSQIRSWCYIEDFCDALIEMIARPEAVGEDFNIGNPMNTLTIQQLGLKILEFTGAKVPIVFVETEFPDIGIRVPSLEKARRLLGYEPKYDLNRGLELTVDWYRKNLPALSNGVSRAAVPA